MHINLFVNKHYFWVIPIPHSLDTRCNDRTIHLLVVYVPDGNLHSLRTDSSGLQCEEKGFYCSLHPPHCDAVSTGLVLCRKVCVCVCMCVCVCVGGGGGGLHR